MRISHSLAALLFTLSAASVATAAPITVSHLQDWAEFTAPSSGTTYETFTEPDLPTWIHSLTFSPQASSFVSATVELSHSGNRANTQQEVWILFDDASLNINLGNLAGTTNSLTSSFFTQNFLVPSGLLPSLPASGMTLALRLADSVTGTNNEISLDFSRLTVVYNPLDEQPLAAVPEPGSMILLGTGLAGLVAYRMRRKRA